MEIVRKRERKREKGERGKRDIRNGEIKIYIKVDIKIEIEVERGREIQRNRDIEIEKGTAIVSEIDNCRHNPIVCTLLKTIHVCVKLKKF